MNQEPEVFTLTRNDFENLNPHYKSGIMVLVQKGEARIIEGES